MFDRAQRRLARPVAPALSSAADPSPVMPDPGQPEAVWHGVFKGYSGYAKANREIAMRVANTVRLSVVEAVEPQDYDDYARRRVEFHKLVAVTRTAPQVRFFGPTPESGDRYRVLFTMMETETVHPSMTRLMNDHYHEVWTPTRWNAEVFRRGGLELPVRTVPLGVNPHVYRPGPGGPLPECLLMTTDRAGETEVPRGFVFVYCFLPSFRKGLDVLLPAFEEAFAGEPDVSLVLAVTHRPSFLKDPDLDRFRTDRRSRVYRLTGGRTEAEMARLYRSCDAYVTASRGEGWNLPMCEAAACGLPVVAPRNTAHAELLDDSTAFLFDPEGTAPWPGTQSVSPWYEGVHFSVLGERSRKQLAEQLRRARHDRAEAEARGGRFCDLVRSRYTWDRSAAHAVERLLEIAS
jgi:glycosyltransferase involved in cell wall biosynthesis